MQVLCLIALVEATTLSRGHHNAHERKHHSKRHARKYHDDSAEAQEYSEDSQPTTEQADEQMNVYVDRAFSPKSEAGAAEFDKYV